MCKTFLIFLKPDKAMGPTVLKRRHLEAAGWTVVSVPHMEVSDTFTPVSYLVVYGILCDILNLIFLGSPISFFFFFFFSPLHIFRVIWVIYKFKFMGFVFISTDSHSFWG